MTPVVRKDTSRYVLVRFPARASGPTRQKRTESYELMRKKYEGKTIPRHSPATRQALTLPLFIFDIYSFSNRRSCYELITCGFRAVFQSMQVIGTRNELANRPKPARRQVPALIPALGIASVSDVFRTSHRAGPQAPWRPSGSTGKLRETKCVAAPSPMRRASRGLTCLTFDAYVRRLPSPYPRAHTGP